MGQSMRGKTKSRSLPRATRWREQSVGASPSGHVLREQTPLPFAALFFTYEIIQARVALFLLKFRTIGRRRVNSGVKLLTRNLKATLQYKGNVPGCQLKWAN